MHSRSHGSFGKLYFVDISPAEGDFHPGSLIGSRNYIFKSMLPPAQAQIRARILKCTP